ncbi:MAG: hypothetical protein M3O87_04000, partial [Candidatus Dormibacteraeota bacterium]|nr:hypothetical protein [Candidatus Dormibacteraeota bacterium]
MDPAQRQGLWERWYGWAQGEFGDDELVVYAAALAAIRQLEAGGGSPNAAAAARATAQAVSTARQQVGGGGSELSHVDWVLSDLAAIDPEKLSERARNNLVDRYTQRRKELSGADAAAAATSIAAAVAPTTATGPPAGPVGPTAPRTAQAWFDEQGILVLSYIGAFLLVVATLLFEIYGLRGANGVFQFSAVLALNLLFGVLGWLCLRSARLRVVGRSYIGIFALMSPLVVVAAYQFLLLREHGVSPEQALFFGAAYCTILYGILATRLGSVAYAWLSLVALPVAAWGMAAAIGLERWAPLLLAGVCVVYLVPTFVRDSPGAALFNLPAKILPAIVGPVAILLAAGYATQEIDQAGLRAPYLPITFFLLAAAYAGHSARWRAAWLSWAVPTAISLGALTANVSLRGDVNSAVLT